MVGVAAVRGRTVHVRSVISLHQLHLAEVVLAGLAFNTLPAAIDKDTDAHMIAHLVPGHATAYAGDNARDLVPGNHGEDALEPLVTDLMNVGVANAAELDVDVDVVFAEIAAVELKRGQLRAGLGRGISGSVRHG